MSEHNCFGDAADRHIGPDPDDFDDWYSDESLEMEAALEPLDALGLAMMDEPEDPSRYATMDEWAAILESPCLLPLADDLGSYAHLVQRIPTLELTSDAAAELRARVRRDAA